MPHSQSQYVKPRCCQEPQLVLKQTCRLPHIALLHTADLFGMCIDEALAEAKTCSWGRL